MVSYAWGGVVNGNIAVTLMKLALGVYLRADAAIALLGMAVAFEKRFGVPLRVTEGYRPEGRPGDFAAGRDGTQWYYYERKQADPSAPAASYPKGSIHGWGLAIDVNLNDMTRDMIDWLHTEARKYGFNWDTTGKPNNEPWHLDFNLPVTASLDFMEDDMYDENARQELLTKLNEITRIVGVLAGWPGAATDFEVAAQNGPKDANEARRMLGVLLGWAAPASANEIAALAKLYGGASIDTSVVRDTITAAVKSALAGVQGADANAIAAAVDARLSDDFAAIPSAVADEQSDRLKS